MRTRLSLAAVAIAALAASPDARAQEQDDDPPAAVESADGRTAPEASLPPPPTPIPSSEKHGYKGEDPDHIAPGHSDLGLAFGQYSAALFFEFTVVAPILAFSAMGMLDTLSHPTTRRKYNAIIGTMAGIYPLMLALPSSYHAYRMSKRCTGRQYSFWQAYLAGVLAAEVVSWGSALLATGGFGAYGKNHTGAAVIVFLAGQLIPPAAEVLTLHLTSTEVSAVPLVLKDGGGVGLGFSF